MLPIYYERDKVTWHRITGMGNTGSWAACLHRRQRHAILFISILLEMCSILYNKNIIHKNLSGAVLGIILLESI